MNNRYHYHFVVIDSLTRRSGLELTSVKNPHAVDTPRRELIKIHALHSALNIAPDSCIITEVHGSILA